MMRQSLQFTRGMSDRANKLIGPSLKKWLYESAGFNQYGLWRDDLIHETPVVVEALRRLPRDVIDERNFRMVRAGYLCLKKDVLPKEQWTKLEDDVLYLSDVIKEVEAEIAEKKAWDNE